MQVISALHLLLVHHRYPIIGPDKSLRAVKSCSGDANDGPWTPVELHGRSDDAGIGMERAAPQTVAQHDVWG